MMSSYETEGFFKTVFKKFGETYKKSLKNWIKNKFKICVIIQQRKFLLKCRLFDMFDMLPSHIYLKFTVTLHNFQLNRKYSSLKKSYQRRLLNLKIKDIHCQLNYLM